ncbi:hypothetical protein B566_EDAN009882, partial [Ephemera danica]
MNSEDSSDDESSTTDSVREVTQLRPSSEPRGDELDNEVSAHERAAASMCEQMHAVLASGGEAERQRLAPDAATLISRGDSLVMRVHSRNPAQAEHLRASQDQLRSLWLQLRGGRERSATPEDEADQAARLERWLAEFSRRLEQANNDEGQLRALQAELSAQRRDIENLDVARWSSVQTRFQHYLKDVEAPLMAEKKLETSPTAQAILSSAGGAEGAAEFVTAVNKIREGVASAVRQLNTYPLSGRDYDSFPTQEEAIKRVRDALGVLKPAVDEVEYGRDGAMRRAAAGGGGREAADRVRR